MLNAFKAWRYGTRRLTERQIEKLGRIRPKGKLVPLRRAAEGITARLTRG